LETLQLRSDERILLAGIGMGADPPDLPEAAQVIGNEQTVIPARAALNLGAKLLDTDINRRLSEIVAGTQITVLLNEPSLRNGMYRIIIIQSPAGH
jgi:hypothetical protein